VTNLVKSAPDIASTFQLFDQAAKELMPVTENWRCQILNALASSEVGLRQEILRLVADEG
jgi:hypothetical protein